MEYHLIEIVRFVICVTAVTSGIALMVKADDAHALRHLSLVFAVIIIYFNRQLGSITYLLIGSALETLAAVMGMTFFMILCICLMLLPVLALLRWLFR